MLAAGLVLPAVTKQWTDSQQQGQLKSDLTTRLSSAVATATSDGGFLLSNQIEYGKNPHQLAGAYQSVLSTWKSEGSAIETQLSSYFAPTPSDDLVTAMHSYRKLVEAYIAYCLFYRDRGDRRDFMRNFAKGLYAMPPAYRLPGNAGTGAAIPTGRSGESKRWPASGPAIVPPPVWTYQNAELPTAETRIAKNERATYQDRAENRWADSIVRASVPIIEKINKRQARGFEVGVGAFLHEVFHPLG